MSNESKPNGTKKLKGKKYMKELRKLQGELCHLQEWVKHKGLRVIIVFEGRDAAGKGGTIRALTERVSPRVFRVVALPAPSDREKSQMYMQRYMQHFPAAGEVVIFDRSWYNRLGVEYVMGFCTKEQHAAFPRELPPDGEIPRGRRHPAHQNLAGVQRQGAEAPLRGAHGGPAAPVEAQPHGPAVAQQVVRVFPRPRHDARRPPTRSTRRGTSCVRTTRNARASTAFATSWSLIPYKKVPREKIKLPKRSMKGAYDDEATIAHRKFIPEKY